MNLRTLVFAGSALLASASPLRAQAVDPERWEHIFYVSTAGSDTNPGLPRRPFRTIQKAIDAARPGALILVHAGTYPEALQMKKSGQPGRRILLTSFGDGEVVVNPRLPVVSCDQTAPTTDRAIKITGGLGYWTVRGLTIVGGIMVSGDGAVNLKPYLQDRSLPGRGDYDPVGARTALPLLGVDPSDHVNIRDNKIIGRGIYVAAARDGHITNNEIREIECGTGGGVWIGRFSDGWIVRANVVRQLAGSDEHYMSEAIRFSGAANYNTIEHNLVEDVGGIGRGITTDSNSSWNIFQWNTVRRAYKGFSEELGGWGNQWLHNFAEDNRHSGYDIDTSDNDDPVPGHRVPAYLRFQCNQASRSIVADLVIGAVQASDFDTNSLGSVKLFSNVKRYWSDAKNTWDGSPNPPSETPPRRTCD